jgi:hypothetical protein
VRAAGAATSSCRRAYSLDEDNIKAIAHFMSRQGADAKP